MRATRRRAFLFAAAAFLAVPLSQFPAGGATAHPGPVINCAAGSYLCTEVHDTEAVFGEGHYVGHDEPSTLFYSKKPGSGNSMTYQLRLPKDPPHQNSSTSTYNFQLHPAFWFGMALCDTQSYPEVTNVCVPDSDTNITDFKHHAGTAFMEMQFYPPGWVKWPPGNSCSPTKWCAALNIDSLSESGRTGADLNPGCQAIAGLEYVNFAFMTKNGVPVGPPNPVNSTLGGTFNPDNPNISLMNSGDDIQVDMRDTSHGLRIDLTDNTAGLHSSMVTSAANGFGQVKYAPPPSNECTNIPYDFHPMYSTSSEETRVPWAAHSYNIAFSDETGHFQQCQAVNSAGNCLKETDQSSTGAAHSEKRDSDDAFCHPGPALPFVPIPGCQNPNSGFDGTPYLANAWPNGSPTTPEPIEFTSPTTPYGDAGTNYDRMAFETDLPRIERSGNPDNPFLACDKLTGANCTLIPTTDDNHPANFYPFFWTHSGPRGNSCYWAIGDDIPGVTQSDFGKNNQYGSLLTLKYLFAGQYQTRVNDFRQVFDGNPCPSRANPFS